MFDLLPIFWWNAPRKKKNPPAPQEPKDAAISRKYKNRTKWHQEIHNTFLTLDFSCPILRLLAPLLKDLQVAISSGYNPCKFLQHHTFGLYWSLSVTLVHRGKVEKLKLTSPDLQVISLTREVILYEAWQEEYLVRSPHKSFWIQHSQNYHSFQKYSPPRKLFQNAEGY